MPHLDGNLLCTKFLNLHKPSVSCDLLFKAGEGAHLLFAEPGNIRCGELLSGEDVAGEVEGDLFGVEGGDAEVAADTVDERGVWGADDVNLAVEILSGDAPARDERDLGFDVAADAAARDVRLAPARDGFELRFVKHCATHACVGDHPKFAGSEIDGDGVGSGTDTFCGGLHI
jgi:hypothetical protein